MATTDRAIKKAYFSNLDGGHIVEFQFAPTELDFTEGGNFADRISTGEYFNDLIWISGKSAKFSIRFFIDRTEESYVQTDYNQDPFAGIKRLGNTSVGKYADLDVLNLITGVQAAQRSSGFLSAFTKNKAGSANEVSPSVYAATPHYQQSSISENSGIISDLEAICYFIRPQGMDITRQTIETSKATAADPYSASFTGPLDPSQKKGLSDARLSVRQFSQGRFVPPPKVRFYYGPFWREGYLVEINYRMSAMNKYLVPRRMDATIEMACTSWGYLNEITNPAGQGIDVINASEPSIRPTNIIG